MKIALYVPEWPPGSSANGIVTYASHLVPALRERGHEVYVLTFNFTGTAPDPYLVQLKESESDDSKRLWHRVQARIKPFLRTHNARAELILNAIRRLRNIDVFEMEETFGWSAAVSSANVVPVVVRLHGPSFLTGQFDDTQRATLDFRSKREGVGIVASTIVTSPSTASLKAVRDHYQVPLERALVIPNCIELYDSRFVWSLDSCDKNRILYVGRFDRLKGGDIALRAFSELATANPKLRLTFVGPDKGVTQGKETLTFDAFVRSNFPHLRDRIDYRGVLSSREVLALRRQHLITIVTSRFEMYPYALVEAMSCGCPVIASSVGGIPELVREGQTGLLFDVNRIESMVAACNRLLEDHLLCSRLGVQARKFCETNLDRDTIATQTEQAYLKAIAEFKSRLTRRRI